MELIFILEIIFGDKILAIKKIFTMDVFKIAEAELN